jgi:hypothetical protein
MALSTSKGIIHYLRYLAELANLQMESGEYEEINRKSINTNQLIVRNLTVKRKVMEELCDKVKSLAVEAMGEPLKTSMSAKLLRKIVQLPR